MEELRRRIEAAGADILRELGEEALELQRRGEALKAFEEALPRQGVQEELPALVRLARRSFLDSRVSEGIAALDVVDAPRALHPHVCGNPFRFGDMLIEAGMLEWLPTLAGAKHALWAPLARTLNAMPEEELREALEAVCITVSPGRPHERGHLAQVLLDRWPRLLAARCLLGDLARQTQCVELARFHDLDAKMVRELVRLETESRANSAELLRSLTGKAVRVPDAFNAGSPAEEGWCLESRHTAPAYLLRPSSLELGIMDCIPKATCSLAPLRLDTSGARGALQTRVSELLLLQAPPSYYEGVRDEVSSQASDCEPSEAREAPDDEELEEPAEPEEEGSETSDHSGRSMSQSSSDEETDSC